MNIALNNTNCKEYSNEEFMAKVEELTGVDFSDGIETATKKARKEVKRLHNIMKVNGWKSEAGRSAMMEESKLYREFKEEHGEASLIEMKVGKASNFAKLNNSKGNGYGNY